MKHSRIEEATNELRALGERFGGMTLEHVLNVMQEQGHYSHDETQEAVAHLESRGVLQVCPSIGDQVMLHPGPLWKSWFYEYPSSPLRVDVENLTAILDGSLYQLPSRNCALFLAALSAKPGAWISSPEIKEVYPELEGIRLDRLKIPPKIDERIDSKHGTGYRLKLT